MDLEPTTRSLDGLHGWNERRSYASSAYDLDGLLGAKNARVSVVLPARNVASTIEGVLRVIEPLQRAGLIDELLVIDAGSTDATAAVVREMGLEAVPETDLFPGVGPSLGKGDALWRGLAHTTGDIVCFFDTDTQNFAAHFVLGLLGPLFSDDSLQLVKAAFHRPLQLGGAKMEDEGGRVTELVARPLLNLYFPDLAGFVQPLAGEVAARRDLLEGLHFPGGYGVEVAMLIDSLHAVGLDALAQVDLGRREDVNQSLRNLTSMAYAVAHTIIDRSGGDPPPSDHMVVASPEGLDVRDIDMTERPPVATMQRVEVSSSGQ
jgi:glucosyl-3-phosphoglycerate synthase